MILRTLLTLSLIALLGVVLGFASADAAAAQGAAPVVEALIATGATGGRVKFLSAV